MAALDEHGEQLLHVFGARVRQLRQSAGVTQERLAEMSGLHRTYVGSLERGERNVSVVNLYALAGALEVPPGDLLPHRPG